MSKKKMTLLHDNNRLVMEISFLTLLIITDKPKGPEGSKLSKKQCFLGTKIKVKIAPKQYRQGRLPKSSISRSAGKVGREMELLAITG
jgi:hypothetical protein